MRAVLVSILALAALFPALAEAQQATIPLMSVQPNATGGSNYSMNIQILVLMTVLTLVPAALITMTSFTRILIVLAILRQAMGTAQTPSNQIILGLALFLSLFIMAPVLETAYEEAVLPYMNEALDFETALEEAKAPFREFMIGQTRENDLLLFAELGDYEPFRTVDDMNGGAAAGIHLTSELKTAFQIGFLMFMPFLIIDLVVASVLMSWA